MKKVYTFLFLLFISLPFSLAQEIITLDSFNPFERIGDTLYFNRNGYDVVRVNEILAPVQVKKKTIPQYRSRFHILRNDRSKKEDGERKAKGLFNTIRNQKSYKKTFSYIENIDGRGFMTEKNLDIEMGIVSRQPVPPVAPGWDTWDAGNKNDTTRFKPIKESVIGDTVSLSIDIFPGLEHMLDSIFQLLNYESGQQYWARIKVGKEVSVQISVNDVCSNYEMTKIPTAGLKDFENAISKYDWPILKLHSKITPYKVWYSAEYDDIANKWIKTEAENNFSGCVKIFPGTDSLFAMVDSFNRKTVLFAVIGSRKYFPKDIYSGLYSFTPDRMADINNDGQADLVLDSSFSYSKDTSLSVYYIPSDTNRTWYYAEDGGFSNTETFPHILGRHFYYRTRWTSDEQEYTELYRIIDGHEHLVIKYSKSRSGTKDRHHRRTKGWKYKGKKKSVTVYSTVDLLKKGRIKFQTYVAGQPQLSITTRNPVKALAMKKKIILLLQDYLQHPEKLYTDFNVLPEKK